MSSLLEQLYFGEIRPEEKIIPKNPEYKLLNVEISNFKEKLITSLTEDEIELLEKIYDLLGKSSSIYSTEVFIYGFKMGVQIITEAYADGNKD
ncbi:hypothetical protein U9M73_12990 [Paenibacillus phoenicis]|uniref:Uncharacterized protein n=1 Tax=Paenibacillus phoenicis TaxID=554117 RepID=A0ABU5PLT5_9BACL|nr:MULTISPECIES: DUF6809 family protein [Paenibacillus]KHF32266.1 hypothetical protein CM49_05540 [Paenibacillus sp. P1XP2]MDU2243672.1 hypothetical protein [Paenibacillus sp.]MEA3570901.1 hypothetical protein [Paenibacillus phoenicis]